MTLSEQFGGIPTITSTQAGREMQAGATIVVDCPSGTYRLLNETASFLWSRIDGDRSTEQLSQDLTEEFEITLEQAQADVRTFLEGAVSRGMITWKA